MDYTLRLRIFTDIQFYLKNNRTMKHFLISLWEFVLEFCPVIMILMVFGSVVMWAFQKDSESEVKKNKTIRNHYINQAIIIGRDTMVVCNIWDGNLVLSSGTTINISDTASFKFITLLK